MCFLGIFLTSRAYRFSKTVVKEKGNYSRHTKNEEAGERKGGKKRVPAKTRAQSLQ